MFCQVPACRTSKQRKSLEIQSPESGRKIALSSEEFRNNFSSILHYYFTIQNHRRIIVFAKLFLIRESKKRSARVKNRYRRAEHLIF